MHFLKIKHTSAGRMKCLLLLCCAFLSRVAVVALVYCIFFPLHTRCNIATSCCYLCLFRHLFSALSQICHLFFFRFFFFLRSSALFAITAPLKGCSSPFSSMPLTISAFVVYTIFRMLHTVSCLLKRKRVFGALFGSSSPLFTQSFAQHAHTHKCKHTHSLLHSQLLPKYDTLQK